MVSIKQIEKEAAAWDARRAWEAAWRASVKGQRFTDLEPFKNGGGCRQGVIYETSRFNFGR